MLRSPPWEGGGGGGGGTRASVDRRVNQGLALTGGLLRLLSCRLRPAFSSWRITVRGEKKKKKRAWTRPEEPDDVINLG